MLSGSEDRVEILRAGWGGLRGGILPSSEFFFLRLIILDIYRERTRVGEAEGEG